MRSPLNSMLCVLAAVCLTATTASAKKTPDDSKPAIQESQNLPGQSLYVGAPGMAASVADTTVLGWWQFDDPYTGTCDAQGWTSADLTAQLATYFHIDGNAAEPGCNGITPLSGQKSMWCGQWPSTDDPWCGWNSLPGYGSNWNQRLVSDTLVCDTLTWTWTVEWSTEPGYDYGYAEYWNASNSGWSRLPLASGTDRYDGTGGPAIESHEIIPPGGWTFLRYRFTSDAAWDDEDGKWPSMEGAIKVDDITVSCSDGPSHYHDFEGGTCRDTQTPDGFWTATASSSFGDYARLVHGSLVVQEDPCRSVLSCVWGFFDDPEVTNYACGGWPLMGAMPYHSYDDDDWWCKALNNEIRSPWVPNIGSGSEYRLSFLAYRDLALDNLQFFRWRVRTRDALGCPTAWEDSYYIYYGDKKDWLRMDFDIGNSIPGDAVEIQVSLNALDQYCIWGFDPVCHSHAPLFDQVRLTRVASNGPRWVVRHIDLWQDNFPDEGGVDPIASFSRCDMAQDILPAYVGSILPGDSLVVDVTDPNGLAADNTGGRPGKAVYAFVRVTDSMGNPKVGKNGTAIQSPDDRAFAADPNAGLLRYPHAGNITGGGKVWSLYRMDHVYTPAGTPVVDRFCCDLMDIGYGATGPHYNHPNENTAANTGVFTPGDVVNYFLGARNSLGEWQFWHRTYHGQGRDHQTDDIDEAAANPCEWSVLPGAGLEPGDDGDILFVDDADDRVIVDDARLLGDPVQAYFDWAFSYIYAFGVDRFDVLGPSSIVGNSLASRVKNVSNQIVGTSTEIYQQIIWNSSDLSRGLVGDGGQASGGWDAEKSDDFALFEIFLDTHPLNPGIYVAGDDVADEWSSLTGTAAMNVRNTYMDFYLADGNHQTFGEPISPLVRAGVPGSNGVFDFWIDGFECYAYGGCPALNDFDVMTAGANSRVEIAYPNGFPASGAVLSQATPNSAGTTARFVLGGFGFDFIRDDETQGQLRRSRFLADVLTWFGNVLPMAVGIEPADYDNALGSAYPNPFNPTTTIGYSIAVRSRVTLKVFNVAGQLITTLVDDVQSPRAEGLSVTWDGTSDTGQEVSSGVYFYKITTKGFSQTRKMVLLK